MKPSFHPQLVNGTGGDPSLYIEFIFEGPTNVRYFFTQFSTSL